MDITDEHAPNDSRRATGIAGSLRLTVRYDADQCGSGGMRHRYFYEITDWDGLADKTFQGTDLESGVGDPVDAAGALRSLVSFLSAAADGYRSAISHPGTHPETLAMFPARVPESAYMNDDELAALRDHLSGAAVSDGARVRRAAGWPAPGTACRPPHAPRPSV
ncbi:hypothetical protein [Myceligenerans crystallogenes]|uniref:Uncharacterized protein n=1 Tax=Myceligenerans crystallogenes TaxID=316335 RepID=A0ABP4ZFU2_9MICO